MGSLVEAAKDQNKRKLIIDDCEQMLDLEVADKRGLSGMTVKAGFAAVKKMKPGMIRHTLDDLLDELSANVDPLWQECQSKNADPVQFFVAQKVAVANAMLAITDKRAQESQHRTIKVTYEQLRPKAVEYIGDAMPRFANILRKHAS